ncbi:hypothetical protein KC19_11G085000 [Ceratodon purpureus]|uniref:60S ribosomal protein L18a-like protein n=1 Tax=Ceratodon purpureus TaxID=3225 RepID=A0A8T0GDV1_CERPU|nr:hypothetical protein KC19_11G085000 [Ceratodon purpureus]
MGFEKGGSYGTFEGQQGFAQSSAPSTLAGTYSSGSQQFASYPVPGYPVLENYPGIQQGSGSYQVAHGPGPGVQTFNHHYEVIFHRPLPFCGLGFGWFLFITGFFFAVFPWVIGAGIFLFLKHDYRERTGLMACTIATLVFLFVGLVGFHVHMLHH